MQIWQCPITDCTFVVETKAKPHRDAVIVGHLYYQHSLSTIDVAKALSVDQALIHYRLTRAGLSCRSFSEAQTIRHRHHPLGIDGRNKLRQAVLGKHYSQARNRKVSQGMRAYWYGVRIIQRLQDAGADIELAQRPPSEVGRAMMGIQEAS